VRERVEQAIELLHRSIDYDPQNGQAFLQLGRAYCLMGEPAIARGYYQDYIELRPKNPLGHIGLGFAHEAAGDPTLGMEAWKEAGLTVDYFLEAGDSAFEDRNYEDALRWYERSTWIGPEKAQAWLNLGKAYEEIGQSDQALEAYQIAWDIDPAISTSALVSSLESRFDYQSIEKVLVNALESYPNSPERLDWWRSLGTALSAQNEWEKAVDVYKDAILEYTDQPDLHTDLGWVYFESGNTIELAKEEMEAAIELNQQSGGGYFALGRLLSLAGEFQEADVYFEEAIQRAPNNRWYLLERADNARLDGDLDKAIDLYRATLEQFPGFANGYYELSQAYRMSGLSNEAVLAIEQAISLMDPPVENFYVRAGEIFRWAGMNEKAITAYRQALILNPENQTAIRGINSLEEN
jgi:superkiller protein 3